MALHNELSIHKQACALIDLSMKITRNIPRDLKMSLGAAIRDECILLIKLIARANASKNKTPHLDLLIESNDVLGVLIRVLKDMRYISLPQHANAIELIDSIGRQANGWRKSNTQYKLYVKVMIELPAKYSH